MKSPIAFLFAAAAVVLAVSPEARKAARRLAVKGTELILDVTDQVKDATSGIPSAAADDEQGTERPAVP
ncbi:hypothetical protein [Paenibacillus thalictri]|uniref:YtxH domain-containing protein n=1 Tax=Paenibacillus thalictri TaxID=2527873 RepID=A0A4Q9DPI5_9BACL|nr:hypothetical protein [Paenibacillus thalictri]TBL76548.1 hypothetical protein EYB31_19150 [Paenibacillus thalictri]